MFWSHFNSNCVHVNLQLFFSTQICVRVSCCELLHFCMYSSKSISIVLHRLSDLSHTAEPTSVVWFWYYHTGQLHVRASQKPTAAQHPRLIVIIAHTYTFYIYTRALWLIIVCSFSAVDGANHGSLLRIFDCCLLRSFHLPHLLPPWALDSYRYGAIASYMSKYCMPRID